MKRELVVLGGGMAGISAAIHALKQGYRPIILEKNNYLGGRVRSFRAKDIDELIDNGQHIISAAYQETRQLLHLIGSLNKVYFQKNLTINFIKNLKEHFVFQPASLPPPLHFFIPLIFRKKLTGSDFQEYVNFVRRNSRLSEQDLKSLTVAQWLDYCGLNQKVQKFLWEPMTLAVLNTPMAKASAYLLKKTLETAFLHSRKNARLGLPKAWLREIFVKPAENYLLKHHVSIYMRTPVIRLIVRERKVRQIVSRKQVFDAPMVISTLAPHALQKIVRESKSSLLNSILEKVSHFEYETIMTIYLFLKEPIRCRFPVAFVESPLQWLFQLPRKKENRYYGYSIVISGAGEWSWQSNEDIMQMVKEEFKRLLNLDLEKEGNLSKWKIIKEKRATILQTPESLQYRPAPGTPLKNLFLAGDWTDTGLPATIESAVVSGKKAVEWIKRAEEK